MFCFVFSVLAEVPPRGLPYGGCRFLWKNECLVLWTASWNAVGKQKVSVSFGKMSVLCGGVRMAAPRVAVAMGAVSYGKMNVWRSGRLLGTLLGNKK